MAWFGYVGILIHGVVKKGKHDDDDDELLQMTMMMMICRNVFSFLA